MNDVGYTTQKLTWQGGCRMREIKCFWMSSCLNIIVTRWNFGARNEILSFAFSLFLWDNASQKLRIPLHFASYKPLICTLLWMMLIIMCEVFIG